MEEQKQINYWAVGGFVLGLVSVISVLLFSTELWVAAPVACTFSMYGMTKFKSQSTITKVLAIAGLILGAAGMLLEFFLL